MFACKAVREQLRVERMRGDRLMESFVKASSRFRGAFRELLGYRVDMNPPDEYKVRPVFASDPSEFLMFHVGYTQSRQLTYSF